MKKLILVMLMVLTGFAVQAQEKKNKNAKYDVAVKGNCEQCQKRIEKAALSVKGVKMASWDVDAQSLHLVLDENKCTAKQVTQAVAKAGHDTGTVKAGQKDYDNLPMCCQYTRS